MLGEIVARCTIEVFLCTFLTSLLSQDQSQNRIFTRQKADPCFTRIAPVCTVRIKGNPGTDVWVNYTDEK